jgi:peptidoglycan/xylan/chitin deacetylase (PgdA/CDA1 family)
MVASLKAATWEILARLYYSSGLPLIRHRGRVAILTYHRVVSDGMVRMDHIQPGMYVRGQSFENQIAYLQKRFTIISLDELLDLWQTSRLKRDQPYCVITFDDGWQDNYQFAFPVLAKYHIPATIFLATDFIGTARWFWPDQMMFLLEKGRQHTTGAADQQSFSTALEETIGVMLSATDGMFRRVETGAPVDPNAIIEFCKGVEVSNIYQIIDRLSHALHIELPTHRVLLNWDEVREMAGKGVTFGSHSVSHRIMTQIPLSDVKMELIDSRKTMLEQGIKPVPVFCYPNGNFDRDIQGLVRESGYHAAVGCEVGLEPDRPNDLFALRRISVHEDRSASVPLLAFTLSGFR